MSEPRLLFSEEQIKERLKAVAAEIEKDYEGRELVLVGILKGAAFVVADLARLLNLPVSFEFVDVVATKGERGEVVQLTYATRFDLENKDLLVVKDVLHTGITENYLITHLSQQKPSSIAVMAIVDKPHKRTVDLAAKYALFGEVPEGFLVGYGLGTGTSRLATSPNIYILETRP